MEVDADLLLSVPKNAIFDGKVPRTAIVDIVYLLYSRQQRLEKHHSGHPCSMRASRSVTLTHLLAPNFSPQLTQAHPEPVLLGQRRSPFQMGRDITPELRIPPTKPGGGNCACSGCSHLGVNYSLSTVRKHTSRE